MSAAINQSRIQPFGSLEFIARQVVEGFITGLHKSPFHGFSVEFAEHRQYNLGESVKNIDWKLFGRTDRLYSKRYEEETNLRCQILIDNSSSMYYPVLDKPSVDKPNKITFSIYVAAALIYLFGFGLMCFKVKEGEYPPPPDQGEAPSLIKDIKTFAKECYTIPFFWYMFMQTTTGAIGGSIGVFTVFTFFPKRLTGVGVVSGLLAGFLTTTVCEWGFALPVPWTYTVVLSSVLSFAACMAGALRGTRQDGF